MSPFIKFFTSTLGRKIAMALTGLALFGFLISHLIGNLLLFKGAETFNAYSHSLITNPLIVLAELILLVFFLGHIVSGIAVTRRSKQARDQAYSVKKWAGHTSRKSVASTTMILSGLLVLVFVPLHLWTFKYGAHYQAAYDPAVRDLSRLVWEEFKEPAEVIWYVMAMIVIGFHLWHGFASAFESLGISHKPGLRRLGHILAVMIAGGFALIPLVIYFS